MSVDQALAFAIVVGMMALFIWGRLRYDVVALLSLLAAIAASRAEMCRDAELQSSGNATWL